MPKIVKPLSAVQVNRLTTPGDYAVGGVPGLMLQVRAPTQPSAPLPRSWILRVMVGSKRQHLGLGSYPKVSLAEAREKARPMVSDARQGVDIKAQRKAARDALLAAQARSKTFRECAVAFMAAHSANYTSDKHRKQWGATLERYAYPIIGNRQVSAIEQDDILRVMEQLTDLQDPNSKLWLTKTTTAKRVLNRIKMVIDYAIVRKYRTELNPAVWKGYLDTQLPKPSAVAPVKHQPSLHYTKIGDFMVKLRANNSISARALEFLILTAVRSGSVRAADWSEINFKDKLWVIPAAHTKTKDEHRVPLPEQAIQLLKSLPQLANNPKIFPSAKGGPLSDMALSQLTRGMYERGELDAYVVPHGFRSTFRDWAAEQTNYPDELRKAASGHTVGDAVKKAYQRTTLLEKRRGLMKDWADFLDKPSIKDTNISDVAAVIPITQKRVKA